MQFSWKIRFAVMVLVLALGAVRAPAAEDGALPDSWITTKAKIALLTASGVPGTDVNVDTNSGTVTLHGTVSNEEAKKEAEKIARKIDGVKEVRNLLQVVATEKQDEVAADDAKIREKVQAALKAEAELEGSNIEVQSVNKGTVLLAGQAENLPDHLRAIQVAKGIEGVARVATEIRSPDAEADAKVGDQGTAKSQKVESSEDAGRGLLGAARDAWITTKVKSTLLADADIPGTEINVDTRDGVVTLFGSVASKSVKDQAEAEARNIDGVTKVRNELRVADAEQAGGNASGQGR